MSPRRRGLSHRVAGRSGYLVDSSDFGSSPEIPEASRTHTVARGGTVDGGAHAGTAGSGRGQAGRRRRLAIGARVETPGKGCLI